MRELILLYHWLKSVRSVLFHLFLYLICISAGLVLHKSQALTLCLFLHKDVFFGLSLSLSFLQNNLRDETGKKLTKRYTV